MQQNEDERSETSKKTALEQDEGTAPARALSIDEGLDGSEFVACKRERCVLGAAQLVGRDRRARCRQRSKGRGFWV